MSKLRALKGVASTLAAMFASRNNDAAGYWGIGKLCQLAVSAERSELLVNLLTPSVNEQRNPDLQIIKEHYTAVLVNQLRYANLTPDQMKVAAITVRFGIPDEQLKGYERFGYGEPTECIVELESLAGHICKATLRLRAAPHNPNRESRRYEHKALTLGSTGIARKAAHSGLATR